MSDNDIWEATWVPPQKLSITTFGTDAMLTWPDLADPALVLEETTDLDSANWSPTATGGDNPATVLLSGNEKYFRLNRKQP